MPTKFKTSAITRYSLTAAILLTATLGCRPVFAIGWTELAIIGVIVLVLFAPLLFRLFRFFTRKDEPGNKNND
jgi:hypothetical protein